MSKRIRMMTLQQHSLLDEISRVTQMMYKEFPELHEYLQETHPGFADIKEMNQGELNEYLEALKVQWKTYSKVHGVRKFIHSTNYLKHYIQLISRPAYSPG